MSKQLAQYIAIAGMFVYDLALLVINIFFIDHAMDLPWMFWGLGEVFLFFIAFAFFYPRWKDNDRKTFLLKVFLVALLMRVVYVVAIGYYYYYQTGIAFEFGAGDSLWYHKTAAYLSQCVRHGEFGNVFPYLNVNTMGWSDQGYILWLTLIYTIFGRNLLIPRILKALMGAYMCVVAYKIGTRTFGERTGRVAAVMFVFMPTLVQMCGLHTKELEMIFIAFLALERMDYLIRSKRYTVWNILCPIVLTGLAFGFRTIVGMCLVFAFLVFVVLSSNDLVGKRAKIVTLAATAVVFLAFLFTPVGREMKIIGRLNLGEVNYQAERYESLGMRHSGLAKNIYLAPGAFVLPLAPMVEEAPAHNKMIHGGTYVTNFLAFFAMLAIVIAIRQRRWRDFSLVGAYELSYLAIIMFSFAANSERFHEPALPLLILMAAYAMTHLRHKDLRWFHIYCVVLFVALVAWNWLKLSARGLA